MSRVLAGAAGRIIQGSLAAGVIGTGVYSSMYIVPPGHRALIYDWKDGVRDEVKTDGAHFRIPKLQEPIIMDTRVQPR